MALLQLLGEALPLLHGVVELGVGVGNLQPAGKGLKTLHHPFFARLGLGQGRHGDRVVDEEGGLDQLGLDEGLRSRRPAWPSSCPGRPRYSSSASCPAALGGGVFDEVDAAVFFDGSRRLRRCQGGLKLMVLSPNLTSAGAQYLLADLVDHLFHHVHHVIVVGVGFVAFQHGELGVVLGGDALVAEDAPQLVDLVEAADDQPLEVQLQGDAQVEVLVEGVVVGDEGAGQSAPGGRLQHRRLHLDKAALVEELPDGGDDPAAHLEDLLDLGVGDEVQVALAVAFFDVAEAVPFLRQGLERLGQQGEVFHPNGRLAGPGPQQLAVNPDDIADVQVLEQLQVFGIKLVRCS